MLHKLDKMKFKLQLSFCVVVDDSSAADTGGSYGSILDVSRWPIFPSVSVPPCHQQTWWKELLHWWLSVRKA